MKLTTTPYYYRYQDDPANEYFLGKIGAALKKASDRVFRDLPKAAVNAITAPFVEKPPYSLNQFQDKKYGAAATNEKNRKIVSVAGNIAIGVLTAGTSTAATGTLTAGKVFQAASLAGNIANNNQQAKEQQTQAAQAQAAQAQASNPFGASAPLPTEDNSKKIIFTGIALVVIIILIIAAS